MKEECSNCKYYNQNHPARVHNSDGNTLGRPHGRCKVHAPLIDGWPCIFNNEWCGEWELKLPGEKEEELKTIRQRLELQRHAITIYTEDISNYNIFDPVAVYLNGYYIGKYRNPGQLEDVVYIELIVCNLKLPKLKEGIGPSRITLDKAKEKYPFLFWAESRPKKERPKRKIRI